MRLYNKIRYYIFRLRFAIKYVCVCLRISRLKSKYWNKDKGRVGQVLRIVDEKARQKLRDKILKIQREGM